MDIGTEDDCIKDDCTKEIDSEEDEDSCTEEDSIDDDGTDDCATDQCATEDEENATNGDDRESMTATTNACNIQDDEGNDDRLPVQRRVRSLTHLASFASVP